ncbi:MAG TPA: methyltransferase domain-containing protein [Methanoregulaceae archaeon]|nr:methyltransferase domain-containing protein [Methanoregulaceae archaeon]HRY75124.1 methyltransferase domain-containing protein [Methanoregulaceae archaeon]
MRAEPEKLPGGPTQDEILAVVLFKLGIIPGDVVLDLGCGTGKVSLAAAVTAGRVVALDRRPEAIRFSRGQAKTAGKDNIEFHNLDAEKFLARDDTVFDCAFVGGSRGIEQFLPVLACRVRRTIVVNAVLLSTLNKVISSMQELGIFREVVHMQVARSKMIAGSIMLRPVDPVYIIVGGGNAC